LDAGRSLAPDSAHGHLEESGRGQRITGHNEKVVPCQESIGKIGNDLGARGVPGDAGQRRPSEGDLGIRPEVRSIDGQSSALNGRAGYDGDITLRGGSPNGPRGRESPCG
jgi:hypothetical protein